MQSNSGKDDQFLISLSDILTLFRQNKGKIIFFTILMAFIGAFYALSKPIKYRSEGSFREKGNKSGNMGGSLAQLVASEVLSGGGDHESASIIKSRKLMKEVIHKLNLQGLLAQKCDEEGVLTRIYRNFKVEWASLRKNPYPVLKDLHCPIKLEEIHYDGEVPVFFEVYLGPNDHYEIVNDRKETVGEGEYNQPFSCENCTFTLKRDLDQNALPEKLSLIILPLNDTVNMLAKDLEIENTKNDKTVLRFSFIHRDRHFASQFVNTVMDCYQDYLKKNHDRLASIQLGYLRKREEESTHKLATIMNQHADFLSSGFSTMGFADSKKEIDFLAQSEHKFKDKLMINSLEIKRLKNIEPNKHAYYDKYDPEGGDPEVINNLLANLRILRQEQEGLEIALRKNEVYDNREDKQSFEKQIAEMQQIHQYSDDLNQLIERHEQDLTPDWSSPVMNDRRFLIRDWFAKLHQIRQNDFAGWQKAKEHFSYYLNNLTRLFDVQKRMLQDRLIHQQSVSREYEGINGAMAKELYIDHCRKLMTLENDIRQRQFFIEQLEDPHFEISSLSVGLNDFISSDMVKRATEIVLKLKDQNYQSVKEQERLKEELALQRTFLIMHFKQMIQLLELNKQLVKEKMREIQEVSLELIRQQISLFEKHLDDYLASRLENFNLERGLIQEHLDQIHQEMAGLPRKWVAEQLIEQQVDLNQFIVKEIAKMVESKNISHNLEVLQSAPVDNALPAVHPVTAGLRFYTLLGAVLGAMFSAGFILLKSVAQGIEASSHNLKLLNQHVSGDLSSRYDPTSKEPISDQDLDTLRRLHSCFDKERLTNSIQNSLLLIEGKGPDYSNDLINLLAKKGEKVLLIDLDFQRSADGQAGLLQYLQGEVEKPVIKTEKYSDHLYAGGQSRYAIELLGSRRFQELIEQLKSKYDWIIAVSHALPCSADAESLITLFPFIAVTLQGEKIDDLTAYTTLSIEPEKKVSFIFAQPSYRKDKGKRIKDKE